jgi:hypothetical protein
VTRLLLIIQFVMGLTITASARDNLADMQFAAVKLSIYDQICAPLSAKYRETVEVVISTIGERERLQMFSEVKAAMVGVSTAEFCDALRPSVQKLENK